MRPAPYACTAMQQLPVLRRKAGVVHTTAEAAAALRAGVQRGHGGAAAAELKQPPDEASGDLNGREVQGGAFLAMGVSLKSDREQQVTA